MSGESEALRGQVSQHDLLFETAPDIWQNGFPIGNGHFGALVCQPDERVEFAVSKLDVWERRADLPEKIPFSRIRELIEKEPGKLSAELQKECFTGKGVLPGFRPCGKLSVSMDQGFIAPSIFSREQSLGLFDATCRGEYEIATKRAGFEAFVVHDSNVLAFKMEDLWLDEQWCGSYRQEITLSREIDLTLGMPELSWVDGVAYLRQRFPGGFEYVMAMAVEGVEVQDAELYPDSIKLRIALEYKEKRRQSYRVYLAVATSLDAADPSAAATAALDAARREEYPALKRSHAAWWADFWGRSGVEFDNKFLEGIWYFSLYQFASTSRGAVAPGLFGLWNASKTPPWCGDYHGDINLPMTFWPIFSCNHVELGEPFFKTFEKLAGPAKIQTAELYQIDGLKFPIATLDTCVELCPAHYRMMQCSTAFYGLLFWNWYVYTQDKEALREHIFGILEEGAKFYLALTEEKDGSLLIGPSWAPEQGPCPAFNVTNDLGLIKPFWQAYVAACEILGLESEHKTKVERCLAIFPDYPSKDGEFIDSLTVGDIFNSMSHPGHLAMVVPGNDVDAESALAPVALKTLRNYLPKRTLRKSFSDRLGSACDLTWPWLLAVSLRLRDVDYAEKLLLEIGIKDYLKNNGMFAFIGGGRFRSVTAKRKAYEVKPPVATHALYALSACDRGKEQAMSMVQHGSAYIFAINEMLMQSHHGRVRIFPAVPECLGANCAFRQLRAEGAFLVSAERRAGKTAYVQIESLAGQPCAITLYDSGDSETLKLKDSAGKSVMAKRIAKNTWSFETQKGVTYFWGRKSAGRKTPPVPQVKTLTIGGETVWYGKKGHIYDNPSH